MVSVAAFIQDSSNRIFLGCRDDQHSFPGHWELPGGKCDGGETSAQALIRELGEELGAIAQVGEQLHSGHFTDAHGQKRQLLVFRVKLTSPITGYSEHFTSAWVRPEKVLDFPLVPSDRRVLESILAP